MLLELLKSIQPNAQTIARNRDRTAAAALRVAFVRGDEKHTLIVRRDRIERLEIAAAQAAGTAAVVSFWLNVYAVGCWLQYETDDRNTDRIIKEFKNRLKTAAKEALRLLMQKEGAQMPESICIGATKSVKDRIDYSFGNLRIGSHRRHWLIVCNIHHETTDGSEKAYKYLFEAGTHAFDVEVDMGHLEKINYKSEFKIPFGDEEE